MRAGVAARARFAPEVPVRSICFVLGIEELDPTLGPVLLVVLEWSNPQTG